MSLARKCPAVAVAVTVLLLSVATVFQLNLTDFRISRDESLSTNGATSPFSGQTVFEQRESQPTKNFDTIPTDPRLSNIDYEARQNTRSTTLSHYSSYPQRDGYLVYFSFAGYANQITSLQNAYKMARLLNRTLLLPPILPHRNEPGSTKAVMVMTPAKRAFRRQHSDKVDPFYHYLRRLPVDKYLPMSDVLDTNYSLPGVRTMDVRDFNATFNYYSNMTSKAIIEIDLGYDHFNTMWIFNQSSLEGFENITTRKEYGKMVVLNQTCRDVATTLASRPEDVLVLLDSFRPTFHESVQKTIPTWKPRMTTFIRKAVGRSIKAQLPRHYVAMHLRTGDGPFLSKIHETIATAFAKVLQVVSEWVTVGTTTPPLVGTSAMPSWNETRSIGLYVATDLKDFRRHDEFSKQASHLADTLYHHHAINLTIWSQSDMVGNTTDLLGGILYADIFWDMQVAVCGDVGFVGTNGSTFTRLIQEHRMAEDSCL